MAQETQEAIYQNSQDISEKTSWFLKKEENRLAS